MKPTYSPRFKMLVSKIKRRVRAISANEAAIQQRPGALLIDVRERQEFVRQHALGAIHASRGILELVIDDLAPDPTTPIICYCGRGNSSALGADSLQQMGYTHVVSIAGGFTAWTEANLPTSKATNERYPRPAYTRSNKARLNHNVIRSTHRVTVISGPAH